MNCPDCRKCGAVLCYSDTECYMCGYKVSEEDIKLRTDDDGEGEMLAIGGTILGLFVIFANYYIKPEAKWDTDILLYFGIAIIIFTWLIVIVCNYFDKNDDTKEEIE